MSRDSSSTDDSTDMNVDETPAFMPVVVVNDDPSAAFVHYPTTSESPGTYFRSTSSSPTYSPFPHPENTPSSQTGMLDFAPSSSDFGGFNLDAAMQPFPKPQSGPQHDVDDEPMDVGSDGAVQ